MTGTLPRRRRHGVRWVAALALLCVAALVAVLATRPAATATEVDTPLLGHPAPAVDAATLTGARLQLSSLSGRWVIVNFFASWCPPCQQEEPELVTFSYQHRGPGDAALVGVVFDDAASSARQFLATSGATWPAVADSGGQIALEFGVRAPPETFIISPGGSVVVHLDGAVTAAGLEYWLRRAQAGTP